MSNRLVQVSDTCKHYIQNKNNKNLIEKSATNAIYLNPCKDHK